MCGILGFYGKEVDKPLLTDAFAKLSIRGTDASGFCLYDSTKNHYWIMKDALSSDILSKTQDFRDCMVSAESGIFHSRFTTQGSELVNDNNHPFYSPKHHYSFVHNGMISNYTYLTRKYKYTGKIETDSYIIAHIIDLHMDNGDSFEISMRKAVRFLEGSFALAFMYAGSIYLIAHVNPLEVYNILGTFYFCSTKAIFDPKFEYLKNHICSIGDNTVYQLKAGNFIKLDDFKSRKKKVYKWEGKHSKSYYDGYSSYANTECETCGDWETKFCYETQTYLCAECLALMHAKLGRVTPEDVKYMDDTYPSSGFGRLLPVKIKTKGKTKYLKGGNKCK